MTSPLKVIASRLAVLNKRDLKWILKRLPNDVAIELKGYVDNFILKAPEDLNALTSEIELHYAKECELAFINRSNLAVLSDELSYLSAEDAQLLNEFFPDSVKRELKAKYCWNWLDTLIDGNVSNTTTYVQEKILCLASEHLSKEL
ncbi:hypothetical protein [Agarivorans sp. DSG3-1]|uniref:hypothetical protein n=1 Tax=Agarivorans sp. DSG3-1 TaxID=3342249 RepID=UPI00398E8BCF